MKEPWWWQDCSWWWRGNDEKVNSTITSHPLPHNHQHHPIYLKGNLYAKVLNLKLGQSPVASSALEQHCHLEMNALKISKSRTQKLNYDTVLFIEQKKSEIFMLELWWSRYLCESCEYQKSADLFSILAHETLAFVVDSHLDSKTWSTNGTLPNSLSSFSSLPLPSSSPYSSLDHCHLGCHQPQAHHHQERVCCQKFPQWPPRSEQSGQSTCPPKERRGDDHDDDNDDDDFGDDVSPQRSQWWSLLQPSLETLAAFHSQNRIPPAPPGIIIILQVMFSVWIHNRPKLEGELPDQSFTWFSFSKGSSVVVDFGGASDPSTSWRTKILIVSTF